MTVLKTSMRNFFAHKGRMALSAVAVLLSVAFVCGTLVFTDTMNTTFDKLFAATSSDVTVSPKTAKSDSTPQNGRPDSLPASVLERAKKAEGVKYADGAVSSMNVTVVNSANKNMGSSTGAPTIAGNWTRNDLRSMEITSGHAPRGPTETMVDADTADKHHLKLGDELRTIAVTGDFKARIVGIATFKVTNPGAAVVYFDTATAQRELLAPPAGSPTSTSPPPPVSPTTRSSRTSSPRSVPARTRCRRRRSTPTRTAPASAPSWTSSSTPCSASPGSRSWSASS